MEPLALLFQVDTFESTKDWAVLALIGLVGSLVGAAWADLKGKIRAVEVQLDAKIAEDAKGYERLTRCEERLDALRSSRKGEPG